jgi:hypothetical protein
MWRSQDEFQIHPKLYAQYVPELIEKSAPIFL